MQSSLINDQPAEQGFTRLKIGHGQALKPIPVRVQETFDANSIVAWLRRSWFFVDDDFRHEVVFIHAYSLAINQGGCHAPQGVFGGLFF